MTYTKDQLRDIWHKTHGKCHLCGKVHLLSGYPLEWEVDHSKPRAKGGNDWLGNYLVACVSCNRSKQACDNRAIRAQNGLPGKPPCTEDVQARRRKARFWNGVGIVALVAVAVPAGLWLLSRLFSKPATAPGSMQPPPTSGWPGAL